MSWFKPELKDRVGDSPETVDSIDRRYRLFTLFWGLQTILEMGKWGEMLSSPLHLLAFFSAIQLCLYPGSSIRLLLLALLQLTIAWIKMPWLTNHTFLNSMVNLTLVASLVPIWRQRQALRPKPGEDDDRDTQGPSQPSWSAAWCDLFSPLLRAELLIVYAWATFHKLNMDWFDPEWSCAVIFWDRMIRFTPFQAWLRPIGVVMPYLALIVEVMLPILLARPRWRFSGVLLGLTFHGLLGLVGFYRFSSIVTALYCLFLPDWTIRPIYDLADRVVDFLGATVKRIARRFGALGDALWRKQRSVSLRSWLSVFTWAAALVALVRVQLAFPEPPIHLVREQLRNSHGGWSILFQTAWFMVTLVAIVTLCVSTWRSRNATASQPELETNRGPYRYAWLWMFPGLVLLNGASPYLGLKTEASFSMFSNLRTAGDQPNHLLIRKPMSLLSEGTDLVEIVSTNDRELIRAQDGHYLIPWMELCSYVQEKIRRGDDFALVIVHAGRQEEYRSVRQSRDAFVYSSWWIRKLTWFRLVNTDTACPCTH